MNDLLKRLSAGEPLDEEQTFRFFEAMMGGGDAEVSDAQIGAYLFATGSRPLTTDELVGGARSLRTHVVRVAAAEALPGEALLDTCGTGGSGFDSFNTSTVTAFVCAAAGVYVTKHGNRAATSKCGSADILEALGIKVDEGSPEKLLQSLRQTRFCFMFAPKHHPATKRVQLIRRELGFRTIFNFLGPLSNPPGATCQLLGTSKKEMVPKMAEALKRLGIQRALVVCGDDGLDEITLTTTTSAVELKAGTLTPRSINPAEFRIKDRGVFPDSRRGTQFALRNVHSVLNGEQSPYRDLVVLNAGAALYVAGRSLDIGSGVDLAREMLDTGSALKAVEAAASFRIS